MAVIIVPTGFCNLACTYCFEAPALRATASRPDTTKIKEQLDGLLAGVDARQISVVLHGGECTTIPLRSLEELLAAVSEKTGRSAVQTNGYHLTPELIPLFSKYRTMISVSWDGPEELNDLRGPQPGNLHVTREYTRTLAKNVLTLRDAGLEVGLCVVLHRINASDSRKLDKLKEWILWLAGIGVRTGRVNPLFSVRRSPLQLTVDELGLAQVSLFDFTVEHDLSWFPYREMINNLLGASVAPCIYAGCNRESTILVSVLPDGRLGSCDRLFDQGVFHPRPWLSEANRRLSLLEHGHCAGCRFWHVCHGGCPAVVPADDPGAAPPFCRADYRTYEHIERWLSRRPAALDSGQDGRDSCSTSSGRA